MTEQHTTDPQGYHKPFPRWAKLTLGICGGVVVLLYAYFQIGYRLMYEKAFSSDALLIQIARGAPPYEPTFGGATFQWDRPAPDAISRNPACSMSSQASTSINGVLYNAPYDVYTGLYPWSSGPGCAWWRFETCSVFEADDFILTQPEILGRILRALHEPCVFLPTAEEFAAGKRQETRIPVYLRQLYDTYACATGGTTVSEKVVINFIDDHRNLLAQYVHYPPDE